ncbi:MAG: methyl-accepting chemotaxis protein [Fibrobacteres bacterium]|nr:methyl-accepting chemotaxis protein [Fibrobacterota bacterium]
MNFTKSISISKKLSFSLIILSFGFLLFGFYSFFTLNNVKVNGPIYNEIVRGKDLIADILPPPDYIIETYLTAYELRENIQDDAKVAELETYLINKLKKEYVDRHNYWVADDIYLINDEKIKKLMCEASYAPAMEFYNTIETEYLPAVKNKDVVLVEERLRTKLKNLYTEHRKNIDSVVSMTLSRNLVIETNAALSIKNKTALLLIILILSMAIGIGIFVFMLLNLKRSLAAINSRIRDMADGEGDLTKRLDTSGKDELGEISTNINSFVEKIHVIVKKIDSSSKTVSSTATDLSGSSRQISSNANNVKEQTGLISSYTQKLSSNLQSISTTAEEMSQSSNSVAVAVEEMSASLNEVAKNCQKELIIVTNASNSAREGKAIMDKLGISANEIGKVVGLINDIADQTNLLALNATIEAASAGEAGRGFAVVASEVKTLAKQTSLATKDISMQIEQMQSNANSAIKAIEDVTAVIDDVNIISQTIVSAVEEQSATINEIAATVSDVNNNAKNVSLHISGSANELVEISTNLHDVNSSVVDATNGIEKMNSSSTELLTMSNSLKEVVSQFKI